MSNYFEGWYLKHQKYNKTVAFIPGISNNTAFIQVITNNNSYNALYPISEYTCGKYIKIGENIFSANGITVDLRDKDVDIAGKLEYSDLTFINYDIMGIFKYFPMECRHGIISMRHNLSGFLNVNGEKTDLTSGLGYIEKDSGTSFPKSYLWVQCNDFNENCSIMASIADIPFLGFSFKGCICVVYYRGEEYRLATYLGVKIEFYDSEKVILKQGKYLLQVNVIRNNSQRPLFAPKQGNMTRTIHESASCTARFKFFIKRELLFDMESDNASFEFA